METRDGIVAQLQLSDVRMNDHTEAKRSGRWKLGATPSDPR